MINKKICQQKRNLILIGVFLLGIMFFVLQTNVYASIFDFWSDLGGEETVKFLKNYGDWLSYGNILTVSFTWLGWVIIKGLYIITSSIEGLIPSTFTLLDFLENSGLNSLTSAIINDLVVVLMVLMISFLGIKMIIGKEPPKFKNVTTNILISGALIVGLPSLMQTMQDVSISFYDATQTGDNNANVTSLSWSLIQENTSDLLYVGTRGFEILEDGSSTKNGLTPDNFGRSNLTALITPVVIKNVDNPQLKHLNYKLDQDENGNDIAVKIEDSKFGFLSSAFDEGYFRYQVNFIPILVGLVALSVAYFFTMFVIATTIIEIGFKKVVSPFVFATDLESGQRTKMVVQDIMSAYMLIAFTGLSLRIYTTFLGFLGSSSINLIVFVVATVSATFVLIKGSSTIMRYFGVDVGLKEGFGQMTGAFALGASTVGLAKKAKNLKKGKDDGKESLKQKQEGEQSSINDGTAEGSSKLKKSVNFSGKGLVSRNLGLGASGLASDGLEMAKDSATKPIKNAISSAKSVGQGFKEGLTEGADSAIQKGIKSNKEKSVDGNTNDSGLAENNTRSISRQNGSDERSTMSSASAESSGSKGNVVGHGKQELEQVIKSGKTDTPTMNQEMNQTVNEKRASGSDSKAVSDTNMTNTSPKMNSGTSGESMNNSQERKLVNQDVQSTSPGNAQTRQTVNQDIQSTSPGNSQARQTVAQDVQSVSPGNSQTRQTVNQDIQSTSPGNSQTRQTVTQEIKQSSVAMPPQLTQQMIQEVQNAKYKDLGQVQQRVVQSIEQSSSGTPEMKQRVLQQVEQANIATPQQATQNIQRAVRVANLPREAKQSVQKVIQEVQKTNMTGEAITQKIVQELQTASFGSKEEFKQKIIQDIQKSPQATPGQVKENIQQVLETVEIDKSSVVEKEDHTASRGRILTGI